MVLDEEMLNIKSFFNSREILLSDFWLESCIKWWREHNSSENYSQTQLQNVVYEQWLLLDLREVEIPSLPPNLKDHKKLIFNGNYCLQMLHVVDISKPKHWQLLKIRNANVLNNVLEKDNELTNTKRMLQLTLTDGVQEIDAIEYEYIPALNLNLPPGVKIRLTGPVTIRRGRIMLVANNIKIFGGEVEEIFVSNSVENVLSRALGFAENPNPVSCNIENVNPQIHVESVPVVSDKNITRNKNLDQINIHYSKNPNIENQPSFDDMDEEEEMRIAEEVEAMMASAPGPSRLCERDKTPDMFKNSYTTRNTLGKKTTETINSLNTSTESDIFNNIDIDLHLDEIENSEIKEISIKDLLEKKQNITKGVFRINKSKFKSVVEKLTATNTAWSLKIEIKDESGTMVVKMDSDVITKLADCPPSVIMEYRNKINDTDNSAELSIRNV